MFIREKAAGFVHPVEGLVDLETQIGRKLERDALGHKVPDLGLVAAKGGKRLVLALPAKRQDIGGCLFEVGRTAHLAHGDRHPRQIGIVDIAPRQDIRKRTAQDFANAKLPLRRAGARGKPVLCHALHICRFRPLAKRGFDVQAGTSRKLRRPEMTQTPGIVVTGASGRMGQMLIRTISESEVCHLVGAVERKGHAWVGRDVGEAMGGAALGVIVTDDAIEAFAKAQAVIDFTAPAATVEFAGLAAQARAVHVIGTTGLSGTDLAAINAAARHAVIIRAGNMSLGVNLLTQLTKKVAAALDADFDIEIVEAHHNKKVDAPSGTALMLGEAAAEGRGVALDEVSDRGRDGITGARKRGDIGFSAIRGGDIVGEHDVIFAAAGERIILRHVATDRAIFARGALKAALWGQNKAPGEYDMVDVLGL